MTYHSPPMRRGPLPVRRTRITLALAAAVLAPLSARPGHAQAVDTVVAVRTLERFAAACDEHGRLIWGRPLCGPVVLVHAPTRAAIANAPDPDSDFAERDGAWFGSLPAGMPLASTAVTWGGEEWAMVLLPLPAAEFDRLALVAHEAFHRIQPSLGLAARDALSPHLEDEQGRLWLRMELRALAAALRDEGDEGGAALHDALRFRAHRHHLYPGADTLEALLERQEGLAEYTGIAFAMSVLGVGAEPVLRHLEGFERRPSYVRALGYGTGPALGLLLDRRAPGWREQAGERPLADMLADAVGFTADPDAPEADLVARAARYDYTEVAREESTRAAAAAARLADIHARLLDAPVLLLEQDDLRATFNPNELVPVPGHGTYYPTGTFQATWGRLEVTAAGALVTPDWQTVRVPAAAARLGAGARSVHGEGWTLDLAPGWNVEPTAGGGWRLVAEK
jgi:hypothetical protein